MREVTDPGILAQLNGSSAGPKQVTDPSILAQLNGPSAPAQSKQPDQNYLNFILGNVNKGIASAFAPVAEKAQEVVDLPTRAANKVLETVLGGKQAKAPQLPTTAAKLPVGQEAVEQAMTKAGAIGPSAEPRNAGQRYTAAALQALPSAALPGGAGSLGTRLMTAGGAGVGQQAAKDAGLGPVGQTIGGMVGGGIGGLTGAERGIPKPPSEAARASKASGIPLTIGQETGSKALTFVENTLRDLFPSAGTAKKDELAQVAAGVKRVNQIADRISAPQGVPGEALATNIGEKLRQAYKDTVSKIDSIREKQATSDYGQVRKLAGGAPVINYKNTMATLDKIIAENENVPTDTARKVAAQARQMKEALTTTAPGAPASTILGPSGRPAIPAAPPTTGVATHTIDEAMKTRSAWGKAARRTGNIFSDIDPTANQVLAKRLFGAINADFDAASTAQTPIAKAMRAANDNYRKASQSLTFVERSALGKLLGEDVADAAFTGVQASTKAPEAIAQKYLTMTPSQAKSVTAILQLHAPEVLQDAKAYVLRNGLEQAATGIPGGPPISFAKFRSQMDKVVPKMKQMGFSDKDIKDIQDVTDTMARAGDKTGVNTSKTAGVSHLATIPALAIKSPPAAVTAVVTPYVASKALLTQQGRDLLRAAYDSTNGKAQAAAIGALRSGYAQPLTGDRGQSQTNPQPTNTQLASPPQ